MKAAKKGYGLAQAQLASMYFNGEELVGGERNLDKAAEWASLAAEKNCAIGFFFLGKITLERGRRGKNKDTKGLV